MTLVGLLARGFEEVVVVEPNEGRRDLATRLGAPHVAGLDGVHEEVLGALGGRAPEVVIECAGNVSAPGLAVELVAGEGTIALVGMLEEPVPISQLNVMLKEVVLRGSFAYRPKDFDEAVAMLAAGAVPVAELITARRPLADAADCFAELLRPGTRELKILLVP
jgi:threonine dehydrogenase-like Zn-dependent dehydrogenase